MVKTGEITELEHGYLHSTISIAAYDAIHTKDKLGQENHLNGLKSIVSYLQLVSPVVNDGIVEAERKLVDTAVYVKKWDESNQKEKKVSAMRIGHQMSSKKSKRMKQNEYYSNPMEELIMIAKPYVERTLKHDHVMSEIKKLAVSNKLFFDNYARIPPQVELIIAQNKQIVELQELTEHKNLELDAINRQLRTYNRIIGTLSSARKELASARKELNNGKKKKKGRR